MRNIPYIIRPEQPADYYRVEYITREAFWNKYMPGCDEHYIIHRFRSRPDFIPQLSLVLEQGGEVVAHIMYSRAQIKTDDGHTVPLLTFGPISVLPEHQRKGYGSALIRYSMEKARQAFGCGAIAITGDLGYYHRFGFRPGQGFGVYYCDIRTEPTDFFMVKELIPGYLEGVTGVYRDGPGYDVRNVDISAYDARFPPKIKEVLPGQFL